MFLARLIVAALGRLPERQWLTWQLRSAFRYHQCYEKVKAWHRSELEKLDSGFRFNQESLRYMDAVSKAEKNGVSPSDARYPDIFDFHC